MTSLEQAQQQVTYFKERIQAIDERWIELKDKREHCKEKMEKAQRDMNVLRDRKIELNRQKRRAEDQLRQYRNRSMRSALARSDDYASVGHKEPRVTSVPLPPTSPSSDSQSQDADYGTEEWSSSVMSSADEEDSSGREILTASVDAAQILAAVAQLSSDSERSNE